MQSTTLTDQAIWEILVPTEIDGFYIEPPYAHHKRWDAHVRSITGGLTINPEAKGQWVNNGQITFERMIPVRIKCTREQIIQIAEFTKEHYKQEQVLAYLISDEVIVV